MTTTPTDPQSYTPPTRCLNWCVGGHQASFDDGNPVEVASRHESEDYGERLYGLANPVNGATVRPGVGGWTARLEQPDVIGWRRLALVRLDVDDYDYQHKPRRVVLNLTAGEARVLAAQLVALADAEDADLGMVKAARR